MLYSRHQLHQFWWVQLSEKVWFCWLKLTICYNHGRSLNTVVIIETRVVEREICLYLSVIWSFSTLSTLFSSDMVAGQKQTANHLSANFNLYLLLTTSTVRILSLMNGCCTSKCSLAVTFDFSPNNFYLHELVPSTLAVFQLSVTSH